MSGRTSRPSSSTRGRGRGRGGGGTTPKTPKMATRSSETNSSSPSKSRGNPSRGGSGSGSSSRGRSKKEVGPSKEAEPVTPETRSRSNSAGTRASRGRAKPPGIHRTVPEDVESEASPKRGSRMNSEVKSPTKSKPIPQEPKIRSRLESEDALNQPSTSSQKTNPRIRGRPEEEPEPDSTSSSPQIAKKQPRLEWNDTDSEEDSEEEPGSKDDSRDSRIEDSEAQDSEFEEDSAFKSPQTPSSSLPNSSGTSLGSRPGSGMESRSRTPPVRRPPPSGYPDTVSRVQVEFESGEDSDNEENDEEEPKEATHKGKLKPGIRGTDTDIKAGELVVMADFYKDDNDETFMSLPPLPDVPSTTVSNSEIPEDYSGFVDKITLWYENAQRQLKTKKDMPPAHKKKYRCIRCDWSFEACKKLAHHKANHRNPGMFACQVCLTLFGHSFNMYNHWRGSCPGVAKSKSDNQMQVLDIPRLRNYVLCAMGTENRGQQYHVFGGIIFIPSKWFLANKYNVIDPHCQNDCHLCNIQVPTKYLECHGDVHRGRFRIDGKIYGEYFCHVCSMIFKLKSNLITHWRLDCQEVLYYTPQDVYLDDEEIVALAWLVLQTTIAQEKILSMAKNSTVSLEKWAHYHAEKNGQVCLTNRYYHFPQEIWPLKLNTGLDCVNDSIPIFGNKAFHRNSRGEVSLNNPHIPVHMTNLLATACPDFYATGAVFTEILGENNMLEGSKSVYKVLLRYTTKGSVISTYKISARTCPSLCQYRGGTTKTKHQQSDYNVEEKYVPEFDETKTLSKKEEKHLKAWWSCKARQDMVRDRLNMNKKDKYEYCCVICGKIYGIRSLHEHFVNDCAPLAIIFPDPEVRMVIDLQAARAMVKHFQKCGARVEFEFMRRPYNEEKNNPRFASVQIVERIGEWHRYKFKCADSAIEVIRHKVAHIVQSARQRYEDRLRMKDDFQPPMSDYVVCPHCGGRMSQMWLLKHLIYRHFYDEDSDRSWHGQIPGGNRISIQDTYRYVKEMREVEEKRIGRKMMPMMSLKEYDNCYELHQKGIHLGFDELKKAESEKGDSQIPWSGSTTIRKIKTVIPLALMKQACQNEEIPRPEKIFENLNIYKPGAMLVMNTDKLDVFGKGDVWLPPNKKLVLPDLEAIDPKTTLPLEGEFRKMQISQTEEFFDNFRREAASNGMDMRSIAEFYIGIDDKGKEDGGEGGDEDEMFDDLEQLEDERNEFEDVSLEDSDSEEEEEAINALLQGCPPELRKTYLHRLGIEDDDEDKDIPNPRRNDNADPNEESLESALKRLDRRRDQKDRRKKMSDAATAKQWTAPPAPYDRSRNEARPTDVEADRVPNLRFLTNFAEDKEKDLRKDEKSIKALSVAYENVSSDFRESGKCFRKWYRKRMPKRMIEVKVSNLREETVREALRYDDMQIEKKGSVCGVVDNLGRVFLDGFITPMTLNDMYDDSGRAVWIIKGEWARKYKVFHCEDKKGKFKFYWPHSKKAEKITNQNQTFRRMDFNDRLHYMEKLAQDIERRTGMKTPLSRFVEDCKNRPTVPPCDPDEDDGLPTWDSEAEDQDIVEPYIRRKKKILASRSDGTGAPQEHEYEEDAYDYENDSDDSDDVDERMSKVYSSEEVSSMSSGDEEPEEVESEVSKPKRRRLNKD